MQPVSVETPQGGVYNGKRLSGKRVSFSGCLVLCCPLLAKRRIFPTCATSAVKKKTKTKKTRTVVRPDTSRSLDFLRWSLQITGVSILRAGETMEQALMAVCKDIRLGKILIQTNHDTGEPEVPRPFLHAHSFCLSQQNPAGRTWKCVLKHSCFFPYSCSSTTSGCLRTSARTTSS